MVEYRTYPDTSSSDNEYSPTVDIDDRSQCGARFNTAREPCVIDAGDVGEIMAALILLFAFDETHDQQDNDGSQVLLHTVKLKYFLELILEQSFSKSLEACAKT